jgi:peroxiredoxin
VWTSGRLAIGLIAVGAAMFLWSHRQGWLSPDGVVEVATATDGAVMPPDFALPSAAGTVLRLSTLRDRVVMVSFWATWCPPCWGEIATLEQLYQAYRDRGLEVLAVASDRQGAQVVLPFMARHPVSFPVLLDTAGLVTHLYGVSSLPTTYVLDRAGRLATVTVGGRDWSGDEARRLIAPLLDGSSADPLRPARPRLAP